MCSCLIVVKHQQPRPQINPWPHPVMLASLLLFSSLLLLSSLLLFTCGVLLRLLNSERSYKVLPGVGLLLVPFIIFFVFLTLFSTFSTEWFLYENQIFAYAVAKETAFRRHLKKFKIDQKDQGVFRS